MVIAFFVFAASALVARAVHLQVFNTDFLNRQADNRHLRTDTISAHRGSITDRYGEPLAISTPVDSIWANPQELATAVDRVPELARVLGVEADQLTREITRNMNKQFMYIMRHLSPDNADKVLALNVKTPFHLTVACLDLLRAAATDDRPARVINIGSIDGIQVPLLESYAYSSSKAAVHQLTRHLGKRLAGDRITVNAIAPGLFPSKMTRFLFDSAGDEIAASTPLRRTGQPDDVAGAAIYLASPAASWVTGVVLPVDGGMATLR